MKQGILGAFLAGALCVAIGVWIGSSMNRQDLLLDPIRLHATATQGHDNFVIATGMIDEGIEALYFLDFLTGDLKATVINERRPGINAYYEYNIGADFNLSANKNPKYLMVTGIARGMATGGASGRLGESILYVVEATTGQMVAYGLPWNQSMHASAKQQRGTFVPVARASLRTAFVRDQ